MDKGYFNLVSELESKFVEYLNNSNSENIQKLYQFSENYPKFKILPASSNEVIQNQTIRIDILKILGRGIAETEATVKLNYNHKNITRKALSNKEITSILQNEVDPGIKLTNVYFHMEKLENAGLIKVIATLFDGRYETKFFGRTGIKYMFTEEEDFITHLFQENNFTKNFVNFIKDMGYNGNLEEIEKILTSIREKRIKNYQKIKTWFEDQDDILLNMKIPIYQIFAFLVNINTSNEIFELYNKLSYAAFNN